MDTTQKMKFSITNFFSKCDQIWSHLLKKSVMENFIFCAVGARGEHLPSLMSNCTCDQDTQAMLAQSKMKYSTQLDKSTHGVSTLLKMNFEDNLISNCASARRINTRQKWMSVSNRETMLKCKTNRWEMVYLTPNFVLYQGYNFVYHEFRSG